MKTVLTRILALGMIVILMVAIGCALEVAGPEGEWVLESYGDGEAPPADVEVTAEFGEGQVAGSAGCNNYFGSYETDGSDMTTGPMGSTMMYCEEPEGAMDLEQTFLAAIGTAETFEATDEELRITYADGELVFSAR